MKTPRKTRIKGTLRTPKKVALFPACQRFNDALGDLFEFLPADPIAAFFERLPPSRLRDFPELHRPLNMRSPLDWQDMARIWQFVHAAGSDTGIGSAGVGGGRILDIGSGDGWPAIPMALRGKSVVGIDPAERCVLAAEANADHFEAFSARFLKMSAEKLEFRDETFNTVMISSTFEYCQNQPRMLLEIMRVLVPGGRLIIHSEFSRRSPRPEEIFGFYPARLDETTWQLNFLIRVSAEAREKVFCLGVKRLTPAMIDEFRACYQEVLARDGENIQALLPWLKGIRDKVSEALVFQIPTFSSQTILQMVKRQGFVNARVVQDAGLMALAFLQGQNLDEPSHPFVTPPTFEGICSSLGGLACSTVINPAVEDGTLIAEKSLA